MPHLQNECNVVVNDQVIVPRCALKIEVPLHGKVIFVAKNCIFNLVQLWFVGFSNITCYC